MDLTTLIANAKKATKQNSPEILTALAVSGVVGTAYLAAKGALKAQRKLVEDDTAHWGTVEDPKERKIRRLKLAIPCYLPAVGSGLVTVAAVVGSSRIHASRTAAAVAAYSLTERAFTEYKEKVVEQIGENKERKIRDEVAQDRVTRNPPKMDALVIVGGGTVLCCDDASGRYFRSNIETLRKAENTINHKIMHELYVTIDEFYDLLGLEHTGVSPHYGWDSDRLMELTFSTTLAKTETGEEPCLVFEFNYIKPL